MDNDPKIQESVETPATSLVEEKTTENNVSQDVNEVSSSSPQETKVSQEEESWENLKGSTQERIKQILHERDEYREKLSRQAQEDATRVSQYTTTPQQSQSNYSQDEVDKAIDTLKNRGKFATVEDMNALFYVIQKDKDFDRLESKYSGVDGLPKFDRQEVDDYMKRKNIGNPEAAFRDMYFDEFIDARKVSQRKGVYTEKPSAPSSTKEEPLTAETLREKLAGPKGQQYYDKLVKNPAEFDKIIQQLSQ